MPGTPQEHSASTDDWTPATTAVPRLDEFELPDLDLVGELTHPVRSRILRVLDEPGTVAEVAARLGVPVTRLYHHVHRLESLGLVQVVATRRVAAVTERRYQTVALTFRVARDLRESSDPQDVSLALGAVFDVAKMGFQREVERGDHGDPTAPSTTFLSLTEMKLSPEGRAELMERVASLIEEFGRRDDQDDDARTMSLFIATNPDTI